MGFKVCQELIVGWYSSALQKVIKANVAMLVQYPPFIPLLCVLEGGFPWMLIQGFLFAGFWLDLTNGSHQQESGVLLCLRCSVFWRWLWGPYQMPELLSGSHSLMAMDTRSLLLPLQAEWVGLPTVNGSLVLPQILTGPLTFPTPCK